MIGEFSDPKWLRTLERRLGWIAIPQISILLITLQALGFFSAMTDSEWAFRLALIPDYVFQGEVWRLVTFLALPLSYSPLWLFFALFFLYAILQSLENEWGAFKTTFYILVSVAVTIAFSLGFNYPITHVRHFESTLFFAAAALFPNQEIRVFFAVPAKMKWLAWIGGALVIWEAIRGGWLDRAYLLAIYSNFFLFFGPALFGSVRAAIRRRKYRGRF